ncbi:MAG: hypothetical protein NZ807_01270 [Dehalococcoidia bacterium]|nr:hypothetical protein [Dehalococcoidia bacterium]
MNLKEDRLKPILFFAVVILLTTKPFGFALSVLGALSEEGISFMTWSAINQMQADFTSRH